MLSVLVSKNGVLVSTIVDGERLGVRFLAGGGSLFLKPTAKPAIMCLGQFPYTWMMYTQALLSLKPTKTTNIETERKNTVRKAIIP